MQTNMLENNDNNDDIKTIIASYFKKQFNIDFSLSWYNGASYYLNVVSKDDHHVIIIERNMFKNVKKDDGYGYNKVPFSPDELEHEKVFSYRVRDLLKENFDLHSSSWKITSDHGEVFLEMLLTNKGTKWNPVIPKNLYVEHLSYYPFDNNTKYGPINCKERTLKDGTEIMPPNNSFGDCSVEELQEYFTSGKELPNDGPGLLSCYILNQYTSFYEFLLDTGMNGYTHTCVGRDDDGMVFFGTSKKQIFALMKENDPGEYIAG